MSRELDVYFKAKELVTTPQALCRFLVQEAEEFVDSKLFKQLAEGAQLWRLRVTVEGKEAAKVTLFPVDSLTLEIKRDQPVNLGNTPINCPYINQQGYQLEVVRGSGSQAEKGGGRGAAEVYKFPIEFRAPISDPTNTDRTKEIRLNGKIPQGMCVVPAISGSAFAQEAGADRDYLVDQFEVTCADYQKFLKAMKDKGILIPPPRNWPRGEMPKDWEMRPVACVSLPQANWFAFWRGKRIPTKVEWVKAAGGQDQRDYPWGTTFKGVAAVTNEGRFKLPQKVGGRKLGESPYGAQDMSGNVWEMVSRSATDISGKSKILGGSFAQKEAEVTISTEKVIDTSRRRYTDVGFRCVRSRLLSRQGKPLTAEEALADSYFGVALAGLAELAKQGPGAHDKIFSKLSSNKRSVRQAAAFYLMQSDAETLRSLLLKKLAAPDPVDRLRAVRALMSGIRPSLVDLLTRLARDPDNLVRQSVYQALVRFGVPKLQNALLKGVKDELPSVRLNSVQGLCDYPRPEVTAALRGCLTDKDRNVQFWAAIRLLERRDAESLEPIVRLSLQKIAGTRRLSRLTALLPLLGLDRVVDATSKHLQSKNVGIQIAVVQSLTYFGAAQFTPWFSSRIRHAKLAGSCASAISQFPTQGGCKALLPLLSDPKTKPQLLLRITSAMGLARYEPAIPALIALLKRRELNAQFKVNILNAIGMIGGKKAQECLYKIYSTPGDPFQRYVYAPMARAKNPGVIKLLRKLRENYVRRSPQRVPQADMLLALAGDDQGKQLLLKYLVRRRLDNSSIQPALQVLATRLSAQEWSALLKSTQTNARFLAVLTLGYSTLSIDIKVLEDYLAREPVQRLKINLIRSAAKVGITEMLPVIERLMKGRSARDGMFNELTTQYSRLLIRAYRKKKMAEVDRGPKKQAHKKQAPKKQAPKKSSADKAGDQGQKGR